MVDREASLDGERASERLRVIDDEGRSALVVQGAVVSVMVRGGEPPVGYWAAMLPDRRPRSVLLLGVGGGTLAHLLSSRYSDIDIVGIDRDAEMIEFARHRFGLGLPNLEIVIADAFDYVGRCERSFDYVAVDLFIGHEFQRGVLAKPFLRRLKWLAGREGEVALNLFKDRRTARHIARIGRILQVRRVDEVGKNVVVHCYGSQQ